jgi:hypothetical protein
MFVAPAVLTPRTSVQADKAYVAPASSTKARQKASLLLCMTIPFGCAPIGTDGGAEHSPSADDCEF